MKILWLCNARFSDKDISGSGTWLQPLAEMVNQTNGYEVVNVTFCVVPALCEEDVKGMRQYLLPQSEISNIKKMGDVVKEIVRKEQPDLVHIWGTENVWATYYRMGYIDAPAFMEMQGMKSYSAPFFGGLTWMERLQCNLAPISLYHFPKNTLWYNYKSFVKGGKEELRTLKAFKHISVQSRWVEDHVLAINPDANIYRTHIILREPFYHCSPWELPNKNNDPVVFTTTSASDPYKGLHIILRAIAVLKRKYPNIKLKIAGRLIGARGSFFAPGYPRFLLRQIKKLGITDNVVFLGALSAEDIIENLQHSNVCVIPSFIETYCVALAEGMMVGTPCVASYAGAMPQYAADGSEALFYNSTDHVSCAARIEDVIVNPEVALELSANGRVRKLRDCDKQTMIETQITNYKTILQRVNNSNKAL